MQIEDVNHSCQVALVQFDTVSEPFFQACPDSKKCVQFVPGEWARQQ